MTISTMHSVCCEITGSKCHFWIGENCGFSIMEVRKAARLEGWRYKWHKGFYVDVCPSCLIHFEVKSPK